MKRIHKIEMKQVNESIGVLQCSDDIESYFIYIDISKICTIVRTRDSISLCFITESVVDRIVVKADDMKPKEKFVIDFVKKVRLTSGHVVRRIADIVQIEELIHDFENQE